MLSSKARVKDLFLLTSYLDISQQKSFRKDTPRTYRPTHKIVGEPRESKITSHFPYLILNITTWSRVSEYVRHFSNSPIPLYSSARRVLFENSFHAFGTCSKTVLKKRPKEQHSTQPKAPFSEKSVEIDENLPENADGDDGLDACAENEAQEGAECSLHCFTLAFLCYKKFCQ